MEKITLNYITYLLKRNNFYTDLLCYRSSVFFCEDVAGRLLRRGSELNRVWMWSSSGMIYPSVPPDQQEAFTQRGSQPVQGCVSPTQWTGDTPSRTITTGPNQDFPPREVNAYWIGLSRWGISPLVGPVITILSLKRHPVKPQPQWLLEKDMPVKTRK